LIVLSLVERSIFEPIDPLHHRSALIFSSISNDFK